MSGKQKGDLELERSFMLRLPEPQAEMVRRTLHAGFVKDYLSIEFQADNRHATVRVGKSALSGKLLDVPTIVESFKTVDKKSFYKTADICQMLNCTEECGDPDVEIDEAEQTSHKKERKFMFNHGVTPPLKNVRKRRFRKTARKKHQDCPEVEKELKRLLRADVQAENVTFELLADEEKGEENPSLLSSPLPHEEQENETMQEDHLAFLQEPISDEEEELDIENIHKDTNKSDLPTSEGEQERSFFEGKVKDQENDVSSESPNAVSDHFEELRLKIEAQKVRIQKADNPFLKQRFQGTLEELQQELNDQEKSVTESHKFGGF